MKVDVKSKPVSIRLPAELADEIARRAAAEDRTVSYWIARLVKQAIGQQRAAA